MTTTDTTKIIAKPSKFLPIGLLISGVTLFAIAWLSYSFAKPGQQQTDAKGLSIVLVCLGLYVLYNIKALHILTLYADRLTIKSIFGLAEKEIYLSEVTSWTEIKKMRGKSPRTFKHLTLYTDKGRYMISSETYADYNVLKQSLTQGKQRNLEEERKWHRQDNLKLAVLCLIAALVTFYFAYHTYTKVDWQFVLVCVLGLVMTAMSGYYYKKEV